MTWDMVERVSKFLIKKSTRVRMHLKYAVSQLAGLVIGLIKMRPAVVMQPRIVGGLRRDDVPADVAGQDDDNLETCMRATEDWMRTANLAFLSAWFFEVVVGELAF